jgi:hypothetical protein
MYSSPIKMLLDRWSPYLAPPNRTQKLKKPGHSEVYSLSKERKIVTEQLNLMRIRIKLLEKEEKRSRLKALNASALTDTIIERRVEKKQHKLYMDKVKEIRAQEMQSQKDRNREMVAELRASIAIKKEAILEARKNAAKAIKESQQQRKQETALDRRMRSASSSPRPSRMLLKTDQLKIDVSKAEEDKDRTVEAIKEINELETLEKVLIEKLKSAYEAQKAEEQKVSLLIAHPVITSKQELARLSAPELPNPSSL